MANPVLTGEICPKSTLSNIEFSIKEIEIAIGGIQGYANFEKANDYADFMHWTCSKTLDEVERLKAMVSSLNPEREANQ